MDSSVLRNRLKLRHLDAQKRLKRKHPHAQKFFEDRGLSLGKIREHSARILAAGALGSTLLLSPPGIDPEKTRQAPPPIRERAEAAPDTHYGATTANLPLPSPVVDLLVWQGTALPDQPQEWLTSELGKILPPIHNRLGYPFLTAAEERAIGQVITKATKITASATLESEHLNTVYGYTGYEQHLQRFLGDTLSQHDEFREAGMAPGLGGYGYFSNTGKLTPEAEENEKWYMVSQIMYLPDWNQRVKYLWNWFKWRKMIMVNVENGNAVVGVLGDSGPAAWTGKHFGGSPEVMNALGGPKYRKGRVLMYFVDDPENKIPLGPIDYNKVNVTVARAI